MEISVSPLAIVLMLLIFLPVLLTAFSSKASGSEKVGWVILVFFTSWLGFAAFLIVKSLSAKQNETAKN